MRASLSATLAALLCAACFVDPGVVGLSEGGTEATGTSTTTVADTTTTAGKMTTTTTTGATSTTSGSSGSSGSTGGGSTTTSGGPASCWDRSIDDWDDVVQVTDAELGGDPRNPALSPDGLTLTYVALGMDALPLRPYRAIRGGLDQPFGMATLLAAWPDLKNLVGHPKIVGDEMVLMLPGFGSYDFARSLLVDGVWTDPALMPGFDSADDEYYPSLTADGARLIFVRGDGQAVPGVDLLSPWALYEASRPPNSPPGTEWGAIGEVALPFAENPDYPHWRSCPVLSPDGLHLLLATSYPNVVDAGDPSASLEIAELRRDGLDAPWSTLNLAPSLHQEGRHGCPGGITADGCQMAYAELTLGGTGDDPYTIWLARRSP